MFAFSFCSIFNLDFISSVFLPSHISAAECGKFKDVLRINRVVRIFLEDYKKIYEYINFDSPESMQDALLKDIRKHTFSCEFLCKRIFAIDHGEKEYQSMICN